MKTVTVPLELLVEVLDNAESDSYSTQAEFSCSSEEDARYDKARELISALRNAAGIPIEGVAAGQGFFGALLAAEDADKGDGG